MTTTPEPRPEPKPEDLDLKPKVDVPKKSSMEILSELFESFDAEPPVIVKKEKSESPTKKSKKKHKHKDKKHKKKDKKRKRKDSSSSSDGDNSEIDLAQILIKQEKESSEQKIKIEGTDLSLSIEQIKKEQKVKTERDDEREKKKHSHRSSSKKSRDSSSTRDNHHHHHSSHRDHKKNSSENGNHKKSQSGSKKIEIKLKTEKLDSPTSSRKHSKRHVEDGEISSSDEASHRHKKHKHSRSDKVNESVDSKDRVKSEIKKRRHSSRSRSKDKDIGSHDSKSYNTDDLRNKLRAKHHSPVTRHSRDRDRDRKGTDKEDRHSTKSKDKDRDKKVDDSHKHSKDHHRDRNVDDEFYSKNRDKDKDRDRDRSKTENDFYKGRDRDRGSTDDFYKGSNRERDARDKQHIREWDRDKYKDNDPHKSSLRRDYASDSKWDRDRDRDRPGDRYRGAYDRDRDRPNRSRSGSRRRRTSRSHSRENNSSSSNNRIDKQKLLEIARKNAIQMMKSGSLPGALKLGPQAQEKVIAAIKAGGKTVEELTDFCKTLSQKEETGELSSDPEDNNNVNGSDSETDVAFHHPFQIKDRPTSITMNIKNSVPLPRKSTQERTTELRIQLTCCSTDISATNNSVPLPIKSTQERTTELRIQFPVSSGQQHRTTENEWVPVSPPRKTSAAAPDPATTTVSSSMATATSGGPLKAVLCAPSAASASVPGVAPSIGAEIGTTPVAIGFGTPASSTALVPLGGQVTDGAAVATVPGPQVFPGSGGGSAAAAAAGAAALGANPSMDIGSIVSQRLSAMRKLQENPNDVQALSQIYQSNKKMQSWAQSKQQPGQFTGSTGVQILTAAELSSGYQAWAKKDQLQNATPVTGGMGMHLLQKMGWKPGEGLGKEKTGALEPLLLEVKLDKRGLVAMEEQKKKKRPGAGGGGGGGNRNQGDAGGQVAAAQKSMANKHPVSLLGEFASKRKLGAPQYNLCFECGPDHKKNFLFKVVLNGVEYQPTVASCNKKEAKALAATVCLQQLGLLPETPAAAPTAAK